MTTLVQDQLFTREQTHHSVHQAVANTEKKVNRFSTCAVTTQTSKETLKKINSALKIWKEVVNDRFNLSRAKYNNYVAALDDPQKVALSQNRDEDMKVKNDYINNLLINVQIHTQNLLSNKTVEGNINFHVLYDEDENLQAVALSRVKEDYIYISNLLTAPWNLRMYGENEEERQVLIVKGAGSSLIRRIYEDAQGTKTPYIRLVPLDGSVSFYQHIGMQMLETEDGEYQQYTVTAAIPQRLLEASSPSVHLDK